MVLPFIKKDAKWFVFQENKDTKCIFYFPISPICVTLTNELFNFFVTITKVIGSLKRENNMEMHMTICIERDADS